jgi:hypothetical protein
MIEFKFDDVVCAVDPTQVAAMQVFPNRVCAAGETEMKLWICLKGGKDFDMTFPDPESAYTAYARIMNIVS